MKKVTQLLLLLLAFQLLIGCTTRKRRDDQSLLSKTWHNMNAHYNGYFNAAEILEETVVLLDEQHTDNYNQQLPMFPYLETDNPSVAYEELDRAVEKVTVVSRIHPYSNWTDDCYLLAGQAMFMKRDYETAEKTFRFLVNEYRPRPERRKKTKNMTAAEMEEFQKEEEEYEKRGPKVEKSADQQKKERALARKDAAKERERLSKQREKERKAARKERERERKARAKARKKGIRLPPTVRRDTAVVEEEPEVQEPVSNDEGPVGMISIFNKSRDLGLDDEPYGDKPGSYILKHRPAFQDGRLWLAWTLIKRDNFDQAQLILTDLRNDRGTFADVRRKALAVQAFLYLENNEDALAIPYLMEAGDAAKDRNERARYFYIAGQIHQQLNEAGPAYAAFEKVVKENPTYALEFGARLNMAQNDYLSGSGSATDALAKLERMLKDDKNALYESQLYYSMANVALRSGDQKAGMDYLRKALDSPNAQANNRVEAYVLLGKLHYDASDYLSAKLYYDSTLTFMPQSDLRYQETKVLRDNLVDIADYISQIELKDSLLALGELPEAERMRRAEEILQQQREAARKAATQNVPTGGGNQVLPDPGVSDYWAYDPKRQKRGYRDFTRKFGDRPLEDNWRRSERADINLFAAEGDGDLPDEEVPTLVTADEAASVLKGVPTDQSSQDLMRLELQDAYFNLGRLYRNRLEDNALAVETLETMHRRFPKVNEEAESWYYLYLAHNDLNNTAKANQYKNDLIQKWNDSKYAKILSDPNYLNTVMSEEAKLEREYASIYSEFEQGSYQSAYEASNQQMARLLGQHPLKPKYALLMAMANGNIQGKEAYVASLKQLISQYPDSDEEKRAKEILRLLGEAGAALPGGAMQAGTGNFKPGPNELHYMILVFDSRDIDLNKAKIAVSDYNTQYHKLDRLRVTNVYLGRDNSTPVLVMRRFKNQEEAMRYYDGAKANKADFLDRTDVDYKMYPVSQSNYREVLKARNIEGYESFFQDNY